MLTRAATWSQQSARSQRSPGIGGHTNDGVIVGGGEVNERYMPGWPVATGTGVGPFQNGMSGAGTTPTAGATTRSSARPG